jgi:predicted dehydrogenase
MATITAAAAAPPPLRVAQIGTKHGHAAGKMAAMLKNPHVDVAGCFEPDPAQRARVEGTPSYAGVHWYDSAEELLGDESIVMVAAESYNLDNLNDCSAIIAAGKHCWFDKPAGDDWGQYQQTAALAQEKGLHIQMGYMLRYNSSWQQVADWARSGFLGQIVKVRANMSTSMPDVQSYLDGWPGGVYPHKGGIGYDLASHCLDSTVWLMGDRRPERVTGFLRSTVEEDYDDNTVGIFEYEDGAMVMIDISARVVGATRRLEVYGTKGTAIIVSHSHSRSRSRSRCRCRYRCRCRCNTIDSCSSRSSSSRSSSSSNGVLACAGI